MCWTTLCIEWPQTSPISCLLTHWGWVTYICVSRLTINGSDNGLAPGRRQAIIWTNAEKLLIGPLATNFSEILIEICIHFRWRKCISKCPLEMAAILSWPQCVNSQRSIESLQPNWITFSDQCKCIGNNWYPMKLAKLKLTFMRGSSFVSNFHSHVG